ncbi:MAG: hypothetical protein KAU17_03300, partial [Spirochaetales bacterium]|nr:hypothetical protein [Spirochaetales bacterium]
SREDLQEKGKVSLQTGSKSGKLIWQYLIFYLILSNCVIIHAKMRIALCILRGLAQVEQFR